MINKETAFGCVALALLASAKGKTILPVPGTPVADLVSITNNNYTSAVLGTSADRTEGDELLDYADSLESSTTSYSEIASTHDVTVDSYVESISSAVRNHISFAKNVVRPAVMEMAEKVQMSLGENRLPSADFCVVISDLPEPMQNTGFEEIIAKYEGRPRISPERELNLADISVEEMLELMKTGSKDYDASIATWFGTLDANFLTSIWKNIFCDFKVSQPTVVAKIDDFIKDPERGVNAALVIYLLSRKLFEEIPDNTGMSLQVYTDTIAQYRDYSGAVLHNEYVRYNTNVRNGTLVASITNVRRTINVNGPVYREWIKSGGSNEVLLGMLVGDNLKFTNVLIDEKAIQYLQAWKDYELFSNTAAKNNSFNTFRDTLSLCFSNSLMQLSEAENERMNSNSQFMDSVKKYFEEELATVTTKDMEDVYNVCLRLVCRSRFFYTESEKILNGINEAVRANPSIDIRQAALLSTIEYVADYVADQLQVSG